MLTMKISRQRKTPAIITGLLIATTALSACGDNWRASFKSKRERVLFEGYQYKAKANKVSKEERDHFEVVVSRANQNLTGARQAGGFEAVKYCIKEYGTSKMDWVIGPETETIIPVDDKIRLEGYCRP